jgi:hypothetical protein
MLKNHEKGTKVHFKPSFFIFLSRWKMLEVEKT